MVISRGWLWCAVVICGVCILGCSRGEHQPPRHSILRAGDTKAALPDADSGRVVSRSSPRKGFNFVYELGWGTKVDTYAGTMTKDLVDKPDTTIRLVLSEAELDLVHAKMVEIGFFDFPEPHPPWPKEDENCSQDPNTTVRIEATSGGVTRRLFWSTERCLNNRTPAWQGLAELEVLILKLLAQRPEWKELPEPRALYF